MFFKVLVTLGTSIAVVGIGTTVHAQTPASLQSVNSEVTLSGESLQGLETRSAEGYLTSNTTDDTNTNAVVSESLPQIWQVGDRIQVVAEELPEPGLSPNPILLNNTPITPATSEERVRVQYQLLSE